MNTDNVPEALETVSNVEELKMIMFANIIKHQTNNKDITVLSEILRIHNLGLTIFEFKQSDPLGYVKDDIFYAQRAFVNGMIERRLVSKLATELFGLNKNIVVSETVLQDERDHLNLYNFTKDNLPLIDGYYPMIYYSGNEGRGWKVDVSGNVLTPMDRSYVTNRFFIGTSNLEKELSGTYSLIQIWSQNINDMLFNDVLRALHYTKQ